MLIDHIVCRLTVLTIRVTRNLPQVGPIRALYEWAATTKTAEAAGMMDWAAYVRRNYQAFMRPPQFIPADSPTRMYRGRPGLRTDCMPNIVTVVRGHSRTYMDADTGLRGPTVAYIEAVLSRKPPTECPECSWSFVVDDGKPYPGTPSYRQPCCGNCAKPVKFYAEPEPPDGWVEPASKLVAS